MSRFDFFQQIVGLVQNFYVGSPLGDLPPHRHPLPPSPSPPVVVVTPAVDNNPDAMMMLAIFGNGAARRACAL